MSVSDHPEVGPMAALMLDTIAANRKPGDSAEDIALICVSVAAALLVESADISGKQESLPYRLERAQRFLESMVDFYVGMRGGQPLVERTREVVKPAVQPLKKPGGAVVLTFRPRVGIQPGGDGDGAA